MLRGYFLVWHKIPSIIGDFSAFWGGLLFGGTSYKATNGSESYLVPFNPIIACAVMTVGVLLTYSNNKYCRSLVDVGQPYFAPLGNGGCADILIF